MKILISYKHYPICGGNYFKWAFEELGHEVYSVGYFSKDIVPWAGNPSFPNYVFPPDLAIPSDVPFYPLDKVLEQMPWKPDLIFQVDAGFYLAGKAPEGVVNAMFATDPHFLDYSAQHSFVDFFFNPQPTFFKKYPKSILLPWAYDPNIHKVLPDEDWQKKYDIVMIGAQYQNRIDALGKLAEKGFRIFSQNGIIYDECTKIYNQGRASFNWSSNDDVPMRIFEGMAYGNLVITNRMPQLREMHFKENIHYIAFDTVDELLEKCDYYLRQFPELGEQIAENGYLAVEEYTYHERVLEALRIMKL